MNPATLAPDPPARRAPGAPLSGDDLLARCRRRARRIPAGTELVLEGDEVSSALWVLEGWLGLFKTLDDGRSMMMDVVLPVDLARPEAGDGRTAAFGVSALNDCLVTSWTRAELARERARHPHLDGILDGLAAAGVARRNERMLRIGQGRATERVAFLVLELALRMEGMAPTAARGRRPALPLSQRRIGELTGLTNVHVCRTLGQLAEQGLVELLEGRVRPRDLPGLAAAAQADAEALRRAIVV